MTKQEFLLRVTRPDGSPFGNFGEVHESLQGFGEVRVDGESTQIVDIEDNPHPSHSGYKLTRVVFSNGEALDVEVEHGEGYP